MTSPDEAVPYLNMLIYGDPGVGKTFFAGTAQDDPDTKPILFLDVEGGVVTLRKRKDINVLQIRSMQDLENIGNKLHMTKEMPYRTVIIDSITELQKLDMRTVMNQAKKDAKNPDNVDIYVPSPREWGKSGERIRQIVRHFRDLPCHTITTALEGRETDDSSGVTSYFPSIPGKLRGELAGFFDIVGRLVIDKVKEDGQDKTVRRLQVVGTRRVQAKDRTSSLGDLVQNPTVPLMWEMIQNGQAKKAKG